MTSFRHVPVEKCTVPQKWKSKPTNHAIETRSAAGSGGTKLFCRTQWRVSGNNSDDLCLLSTSVNVIKRVLRRGWCENVRVSPRWGGSLQTEGTVVTNSVYHLYPLKANTKNIPSAYSDVWFSVIRNAQFRPACTGLASLGNLLTKRKRGLDPVWVLLPSFRWGNSSCHKPWYDRLQVSRSIKVTQNCYSIVAFAKSYKTCESRWLILHYLIAAWWIKCSV